MWVLERCRNPKSRAIIVRSNFLKYKYNHKSQNRSVLVFNNCLKLKMKWNKKKSKFFKLSKKLVLFYFQISKYWNWNSKLGKADKPKHRERRMNKYRYNTFWLIKYKIDHICCTMKHYFKPRFNHYIIIYVVLFLLHYLHQQKYSISYYLRTPPPPPQIKTVCLLSTPKSRL